MSTAGVYARVRSGAVGTSALRSVEREDTAVRSWLEQVAVAYGAFERRWTMAALRRVDPDICRRLSEQRDLFDQACVTGSADEVAQHGAAMCRGYAASVKVMEASGETDDAYMLGQSASGFRIAIGHLKASAARVSEVHGSSVVWVTPDEVAALMAELETFKALAAVKRVFPGAELIDRHPGEPAKLDSGLEDAA